MKHEHVRAKVEVREAEGGPRLVGTILQEGRAAAGGRAEVFAPGSVIWPESGIEIRTRHRGRAEAVAMPVRAPDGSINIAVRATPAMVEAVRSGNDGMSVEFMALREHRTAGGVREVRRAYVDGASLTDNPEYSQGRAELRERRRRAVWL